MIQSVIAASASISQRIDDTGPFIQGLTIMHWSDEGIILSTRRHGETSVIVDLLTRHNGRHAGMVRGGRGKRYRPVLQLGNRVNAAWKARLPEHLGMYVLEPAKLRAALIMEDALRLLALQSICMLASLIAEREPHHGLFEASDLMIKTLANGDDWKPMLVQWELGLLGELGYGLDLTSCAATGVTNDLIYVSPKSSRAVSRKAGEPYHDRLLPLPAFLVDHNSGDVSNRQVKSGLKLTGHFLANYLQEMKQQELPPIRQRLYSDI